MSSVSTSPETRIKGAGYGRVLAWLAGFSPTSIIMIVGVGLLVLPPIIFLVQGSLFVNNPDGTLGDFTLRYYERLIADGRLLTSALNAIIFALGSATLALLLGGVLAWIVERTNAPFRALAYLTTIISLGTPYVLYVSAWLFLLGRSGPINVWYRDITGSQALLFNVYSLEGMILVEALIWAPLVFLLLSATFRLSNPELEEAARMSGASVWQTITKITLRLAVPSVLALALLVFIRSIEAFEVPALVGMPGRVYVLTTDIYMDVTNRMPPDLGYASAFAGVLLIFVGILLHYYGKISKSAERYQTVTGKGYRPRPFDLGRGRWLAGAVVILNFILLLVLPMLMLLWASLLPFYQSVSLRAFGMLTLDNYRVVLETGVYFDVVWNTLFVSALSATFAMAITVIGGWIAVRRKPGGWLIDQLSMTPLIFPGIVLAVAMMQVLLAVPIAIYGTIWALTIAYVIRYIPYGMRYSYSGMLQIHKELEEAAGVAGASPMMTLRRIIAPLMAPAIIAGWLFIFLLGARVLSLPLLLSGPDSQVMSVAMFDMWVNGQGTELAAMGLLWTALMTIIAFLFYAYTRRGNGESFGS